jgi:phage tail tape-measure protein
VKNSLFLSQQENDMARDTSAVTESGGRNADANRDPISGEPGAHPVGTGVGAAAAGAADGAAGGLIVGPAGAAVGAAIGAVAGGLAGKGVAESIDPTVEDAYWRENYAQRPYYDKNSAYEEYQPAYKYGWESQSKYAGRSFGDVDKWCQFAFPRGKSKLTPIVPIWV